MGEQQPSQQGEHSTAEHAPETEHESEEEPPAEQNSDDKPEDWAAETGPSRFATWQWCQKKKVLGMGIDGCSSCHIMACFFFNPGIELVESFHDDVPWSGRWKEGVHT